MKPPKIINVSTANVRTDLSVYRGDHLALRFVPSTPLSGTVHFTVAARPNSRTKIVETRICPLVDEAFETALMSADTNVEPGSFFWDARLADAGSETLLGSGSDSDGGPHIHPRPAKGFSPDRHDRTADGPPHTLQFAGGKSASFDRLSTNP